MKNIQTILKLAIEFLQKQGMRRPRKDAEALLAHFLGLKRIELYMYHDRPIEEKELEPFRLGLRRRVKGEPLEYILGEVDFYHCQLDITPSVLIPRQETEILLDLVCKRLAGSEKVALDLCTGSGCLAIGLKKACPSLQVYGVDICPEALSVARKNGAKNGVEVEWREGDLIEPVKEVKFDLVLCNPPYISEAEFKNLDREVRAYEPEKALVSGSSGYEFFERLVRELPPVLNPGAKVFFEMGSGQGAQIFTLFSQKPWLNSLVEPDWAGHDRFFSSIFLEKD